MRLIVDSMLGRLAKWLRAMGYDTLYAAKMSDSEIVRLARLEDRVILTRDTQIPRRRGVRAVLIRDETLDEQVRQLAAEVGLNPLSDPLTRCINCNTVLADLSQDEAEGLVPPYVFATQSHFKRCPSCRRVFWRGTHWAAMMERLGIVAHPRGL